MYRSIREDIFPRREQLQWARYIGEEKMRVKESDEFKREAPLFACMPKYQFEPSSYHGVQKCVIAVVMTNYVISHYYYEK